ncbi:MAG: UvrD-helicase domain-containing protein, partial [Chromatiales bacterium]|nr:UvrD-helicase domain-containing protein [Chromatiales bacterium]
MSTGSAPEPASSDHAPVDFPLDRAGTTFIEASAGTGKTHALTTLVARLVIEEGWPIDRILVVTFTRAATAELRDRIRRVLGMLLDAVRARLREAALPAGRIRGRSTSLRRNSTANSLDSRLRGNDEQALVPSFPR